MNSSSLAGCSILICEDEPLIAIGIADAFTNAGARVVMARSLASALIAVENEVPSAVILDHALSDGESSQLKGGVGLQEAHELTGILVGLWDRQTVDIGVYDGIADAHRLAGRLTGRRSAM